MIDLGLPNLTILILVSVPKKEESKLLKEENIVFLFGLIENPDAYKNGRHMVFFLRLLL